MPIKSSCLPLFINFEKSVENLLSSKIKILESDGGMEFSSHTFQQFLIKHEITHWISCPHTPQQKVIVKCKHKYIVETSLALMTRSSMPNKYCDYAFYIATFLIHLPIQTIHNLSPWPISYHKPPNYSMLKVIG